MKNSFSRALVLRLISSIVILFLLITFLFFLLRIAPGGPEQKFISPQLKPELAQKIKESFNLDKPVLQQYEAFITNLISGDFGTSYNYREPVFKVILNYLPFTLLLSLIVIIVQFITGFFLSYFSVLKINTQFDKFISKLSLILFSIPTFVAGVFLIYIFSEKLNLLPSSGAKSIFHSELNLFGQFTDYFSHLVLPVITLSLGGIAVYYRYLRDNIEEIYNKQFVLNLRAMGVGEKEITLKHVISECFKSADNNNRN